MALSCEPSKLGVERSNKRVNKDLPKSTTFKAVCFERASDTSLISAASLGLDMARPIRSGVFSGRRVASCLLAWNCSCFKEESLSRRYCKRSGESNAGEDRRGLRRVWSPCSPRLLSLSPPFLSLWADPIDSSSLPSGRFWGECGRVCLSRSLSKPSAA